MIRGQYFANFVGDVTVTLSDIKKTARDPPFCLHVGVLGSNLEHF